MDERPLPKLRPLSVSPTFVPGPPNPAPAPRQPRRVPPAARLLMVLGMSLALPATAFAFWWLPSQSVEDSLPRSASSVARTSAALCDRGAEGWCYGLAFMYACGDEGLAIDMARAAELEQRECLVDPAHCQAAETMIGEWDSIGADMQMFSCRRNRIDTAQGLEALPDFLERNGAFVAAPVFAADME
jgi:hypothetical protein